MSTANVKKAFLTPKFSWMVPYYKDNLAFVVPSGDYAYGTITDSSAVGFRGVALQPRSYLDRSRHYDDNNLVYGLVSFSLAAAAGHPAALEMLGCRPEQYVHLSKAGKLIITNRKMFLSQNIIKTFGGYADKQLQKMHSALSRGGSARAREMDILDLCLSAVDRFNTRYKEVSGGGIQLSIAASSDPISTQAREIVADVSLSKYPLRDYAGMFEELSDIVRLYGTLSLLNDKEQEKYLNENAMHLIRLYLTAIDILEKEQIVTYRANDLSMLSDIRAGKYMRDDGTYDPELFDMAESLRERMLDAAAHTSLPKEPDISAINTGVQRINELVHEPDDKEPYRSDYLPTPDYVLDGWKWIQSDTCFSFMNAAHAAINSYATKHGLPIPSSSDD